MLVAVTSEPGPISTGRCVGPRIDISLRGYIGCPAARRALARYLAHPGRSPVTFRSGDFAICTGDGAIGGFCSVTFADGAQGYFTYIPRGR